MKRLTLAVALLAAAAVAVAQEPPKCFGEVEFVPLKTSLAELPLAVVGQHLSLQDVSLLAGPCAEAVYSVRMGQLAFAAGTQRAHPQIADAEFIMAVNADRALDVGVWKTGAGYLVAAYVRQAAGFSAPVPLLRSTQPIKSVTYFPSPDAPGGKLSVLTRVDGAITLVSLSWYHRDFQ
nr:hypothetical protein [uncultured Duganella sp.]